MKTFSSKITIAIIAFALTSCASTNFISIDVMTPARVSFPSNIVNVTVVDNAASQPDNEGHIIVNYHRQIEEIAASSDTAKLVFKEALTQFMNEDNYFNKVALYSFNMRTDDDYSQVSILTKNDIEDICRKTDADAVFSLDLFMMSSDIVLGKYLPYDVGINEMKAKIGISYRVFDRGGELMAGPVIYVDSIFWNNAEQSLPLRQEGLKELALISAEKITKELIPSWEKQDRWYYSDGKSEMKAAEKLVKEGNWHDAALIWGELYEKEVKNQRKIKLASNIALANECLDDIENAAKWIDIAYSFLPAKSEAELALMTILYKKQLDARQKNIPKLKAQLGDE